VHFDEIVLIYDKIRLNYPDELFKEIISFSGLKTNGKALEIGAGTGKATKMFLEYGCDVTAVELGENMSEFLNEKFHDYKNFNVITDSFENAEIKNENFDIIYAATAFHWVDSEIGCPKAFRLLKKGGTFALFRYNAIPNVGEPLYEEIEEAYDKYYASFYTQKSRPTKRTKEDYSQSNEIKNGFGFEDMKKYGFSDISMNFFEYSRTLNTEQYIDWLETMSDHRVLPEENRSALYAAIRATIEKHGGFITSDYLFQLYMGKK